jgi:hypothetical protein
MVNWNILLFSFRPFEKCSKFSIIFRKIKTTNDMIKIRLCFIKIPNIYLLNILFSWFLEEEISFEYLPPNYAYKILKIYYK